MANEKNFGLADDEGWIEWTGGDNPLGPDVFHQRRYRDQAIGDWTNGKRAGDYHWKHDGGNADIIAYRLRPEPKPEPSKEETYRKALEKIANLKTGRFETPEDQFYAARQIAEDALKEEARD